METREETTQARIQEIARKVTVWCEAKGKTLTWLIRKYDTLGSARTLRDMRDGKFDGYNLENQLANYETALAMIEADDPAQKSVGIITTLTGPIQLRRAVLEAMNTNGIDRIILLLGDSGAGKTESLKALRQEYDTVYIVEALQVWSDSPSALLCDILKALGEETSPTTPAYSLFGLAVKRLSRRRVTICIDEAHQMGARCLNTIKGLVNATPGEFVLAGQPTLWTLLQAAAHLELRQLVTNRLREKIAIGLNVKDVSKYIAHVFPSLAAEKCLEAAETVCALAKNMGNMAFVRDCCGKAAQNAADPNFPEQAEWAAAAKTTASRK